MNESTLVDVREEVSLKMRCLAYGATYIEPHDWTLSKDERHRKIHGEINAIRMRKARRFQATPETKEGNAVRMQKARAQAIAEVKGDGAIQK